MRADHEQQIKALEREWNLRVSEREREFLVFKSELMRQHETREDEQVD